MKHGRGDGQSVVDGRMLAFLLGLGFVWVALRWPVAFRDFLDAISALGRERWPDLAATSLLAALRSHGTVVLLTAAVGLSFSGVGRAMGPWLPAGGSEGRFRWPVAVLLGFATMGAAFLGLALTGLFHASLLVFFGAVGLGLPGARGAARAVTAVRRIWPAGGCGWIAIGLVPVALAVSAALVPEFNGDAYQYHLADPDRFLREHKFTTDGQDIMRQFPHTAEMVYSLAIIAGYDQVAHGVNLLVFSCGAAMVCAWAAAAAGLEAAWLGAVLIGAFPGFIALASAAKSDLAVAGLGAGGMVALACGLAGEGRCLWVAAVLLGAGAATKFTGLVVLGVGAGVFMVGRRRAGSILPWVLLAALPVSPWLVKTWLMTGDPVWPTLSAYVPGAWIDQETVSAIRIARGSVSPAESLASMLRSVPAQQPALALLLPLAMALCWRMGRESRWLAGSSLLVMVIQAGAMPDDWVRFALPAWVVWSGLAASAAGVAVARWSRVQRTALFVVLAAGGWLPAAPSLVKQVNPPALEYLTGSLDREGYYARRLPTYRDLQEALEREHNPDCVLMLGVFKTYRLGARCMSEWIGGRTWAWKLARECDSEARLRIKFRQLGCSHVIANPLDESVPHPWVEAFAWDDRMLALWRRFVERDLVLAAAPSRLDYDFGAFCLYALRSVPLRSSPEYLPYLPGVESLYYDVTRFQLRSDARGMLMAALRLRAKMPRVDFVSDLVGMAYRALGNWSEAYRFYEPGVRHGTITDQNFWNMAIAAASMGRLAESLALFRRAGEIYPFRALDAKSAMADVRRAMAERESAPALPR